MTADRIGWWSGHQFGIVPRTCIEAITATAADVEGVSGPTSVAVFSALSVAADKDGSAGGGMAAVARMLDMNYGSVRRVVAACLEPAGVATRTPDGVILHTPTEAADARGSARPTPQPPARHRAPTPARQRAPHPRGGARPPITDGTENQSDPPVAPHGQLALAPTATPAPADRWGLSSPQSLGSDRDLAFVRFWQEYPRRAGKGQARKAWTTARRRGVPPEVIVAGARRYARDPNREDAYTKLPATWLNGECWDDEPLPDRPPPSGSAPTTAAAARRVISRLRNEPTDPAVDPDWLALPAGGVG